MRPSHGRLFAIATVLAVAGCGTASTGTPSGASSGTSGPASGALASDHTAIHPLTPSELARELIKSATAPPDATRSRHAPTKLLRNPPERSATSGVTVRYRWWRIAEPWRAAYSWVAHHQSGALRHEASGAVGGPSLRDNEKYADFAPAHLPASVNSALLTVAVEPLTKHTAAIGAYAVVVRQPRRPVAENVPLTVDRVTLVGRKTAAPGDKPVTTRRTVKGRAAHKLVRDFDRLVVRPNEGPLPCPISLQTQTAKFRDDEQVWVVTNGFCDAVTVTLNGHRLPALQASDKFTRDLTKALGGSASAATATDPFAAPAQP